MIARLQVQLDGDGGGSAEMKKVVYVLSSWSD